MSKLILLFNKKLLKAFDRLDCKQIIIHIVLGIQYFDSLLIHLY